MKAQVEKKNDGTCTLTLSEASFTELSRVCSALNDYNGRAPGRQSTEEAERVIAEAMRSSRNA